MPTIPPTDTDWQSGKSLKECTQYMFEHEIACDVTFLLGKEKQKVRAHKFILIGRSPVFSAVFCGPLAEKGEAIAIPDIEPEVFRVLLRYMYCDLVKLEVSIVSEVLYAANKYCVTKMSRACRQYILENVDVNNACFLLDEVYRLNEDDLVDKCFEFILRNGEECLQSRFFRQMSRPCIQKLIEADDFIADELNIWDALVEWAEVESERKGIPQSDAGLRNIMGDIVYLIRFRRIDPKIFAKSETMNRILAMEERLGIYRFCLGAFDVFEQFSTKLNRGNLTTAESYIKCMRMEFNGDYYFHYDGVGTVEHGISFKVSSVVDLCGLILYTCIDLTLKSTYTIHINLTDESGNELLSEKGLFETKPGEKTFDVMFKRNVRLKPNICHSIGVCMTGPKNFSGHRGKSSVTAGGVTVDFTNIKDMWTDTDVDGGQIPGLIMRKVF